MRIWRKTNAERQALRGCCGGLVDKKVHSKKVHAQPAHGNIQNGMEVICKHEKYN